MARRVCLISPGNLAANPRLVKEADALQETGYDVTVVVSDYSPGLRSFDDEIAAKASWKVVRARRSGSERYVGAASRIVAMAIRGVGREVPEPIAARSYGGPIAGLQKAACSVPADLYIAHYVAALPAAGRAAFRHGALLGFDAEDFHTGEGTDTSADQRRMDMAEIVEATWLPLCRHVTAAAPLIAKAYAARYAVAMPTTVLNVFPRGMAPTSRAVSRSTDAPLRAYWFSQTIGLDRGLQPFIQAMALANRPVELELRGDDRQSHGQTLLAMARDLGIGDRVRLLPMAPPQEMVRLAATYDLGLSLETSVSENRRLCLTNKIFTYLLAGLPVMMSDTPAQCLLAPELGAAAELVSLAEPAGIAVALERLGARLDNARAEAARLGRERYNWEIEKSTLQASVDRAFTAGGAPWRH